MSEPFGTWQLDSLIAAGGLGEVWRAHRDGLIGGRPAVHGAAIKRMHTHLARNDEAREMFAQEQLLTMSLPHHPGVVRGIEPGNVDGRAYLAYQLAPGQDLRRIVVPGAAKGTSENITLPRARALAILRNACDAVAHLHRHGWVHGDVCPANLIVDDEAVVLVDLGVARTIGTGGSVRGTHAYMAPEQVRGEAWTPATDVFALGVVLWELSAGKRLFHRGPPWLTMAAVVEEPVPALADPELAEIVAAALVKDPAARIPTAAELAARLCN